MHHQDCTNGRSDGVRLERNTIGGKLTFITEVSIFAYFATMLCLMKQLYGFHDVPCPRAMELC